MSSIIRKERKRFRRNIKKQSVEMGKRHHWFMVLYNKFMLHRRQRIYKKYYRLPTDEKLIFFQSFWGRQFSDSPKAIYLKMVNDERYSDYHFVWAFKKPKQFQYLEDYPRTTIVRYFRRPHLEAIARSKYWVTNTRLFESIKKKDDQVYIQCWHGTPLKKLGYDITVKGANATNTNEELSKKYSEDAAKFDYFISPSDFATEKFVSAFRVPDPSIMRTIGYPRNDFLYNYSEEDVKAIKFKLSIEELAKNNSFHDIKAIKNNLGIDDSKKIILYAPTWRDNQHVAGQGFTYDLNIDFGKLQEIFGDEYIILFRAHYFISNSIDLSEYKGFVYDVSLYDDVNELYVISDLLITDYSSVFFDFANLKRPIMFYMYDFEEYKNVLHDFYIDMEELPGPITKTQDELIDALKNLDSYYETYAETYKAFYDKYDYLDDGNASQRLIDECIVKR